MAKRVRCVIKLSEPQLGAIVAHPHTTFQTVMECLQHAGKVKTNDDYSEIEFGPPDWVAKKKQWGWAQGVRDRAATFGLKVELREWHEPSLKGLEHFDDPIRTKVIPYEEILMLTGGQYPRRYCPRSNTEETRGVVVEERGELSLKVGRGFEQARWGHKAFLTETDPQGRVHYQMDTGLRERRMVYGSLRWIPPKANVLVAGLGLGVVVLNLAKKPRGIHIVEVNTAVRDLIWHRLTRWCEAKHYPGELSLEINDIQTHLRFTTHLYDIIYLDIWDHMEKTSLADVEALEALARRRLKLGGRVITWARKTLKKR
jgi:hypothetical protein